MPYGMYISAEGASAQAQRLEVIANNLANADTAGFKQDVYGVYLGSFFKFPPQDIAKEMVELWKDSTTKLPFRFGYYDNRRNPHLMYTHK